MPTVLVAASPEQPNLLAHSPVVEALLRRGHRVVYLGAEEDRRGVETRGVRFVPVPAATGAQPRATSGLPGVQQIRDLVRERFLAPLDAQWRLVQEVLAEEAVDVVVTDPLFLGASLTSLLPASGRPPVVALGLFPLPFDDPEVAPYGMGLPPLRSALNRPRNVLLGALAHRVLLRRVNAELMHAAERLTGVRIRGTMQELASKADVWAQLTVPGFEYPRSRLPENVRHLGPLPPAVLGDLPAWWSDADARPIVYVCHRPGTNPHDLVLPTVRGLADEPVRVVVTAGRDVDLVVSLFGASLPDNVHVERAVPFAHLMPRTTAVVCSGGWLLTQYALRWGVPLVVAGVDEDQVETNAHLPWLGVGEDLRTRRPTPEAVRLALMRVVSDPAIRSATARIAAQISTTDALGDLCGIVEGLAAARERPETGAADRRTTSSIGS